LAVGISRSPMRRCSTSSTGGQTGSAHFHSGELPNSVYLFLDGPSLAPRSFAPILRGRGPIDSVIDKRNLVGAAHVKRCKKRVRSRRILVGAVARRYLRFTRDEARGACPMYGARRFGAAPHLSQMLIFGSSSYRPQFLPIRELNRKTCQSIFGM
jgi:hypothetical protein